MNSTRTLDNPIVNPNWLTDPRDQDVANARFKRTRQVFATDSIRPVLRLDDDDGDGESGGEMYPGRNVTSDEEMLEIIRTSAVSIDYTAGTWKMARLGDRDSVVDGDRVYIGTPSLNDTIAMILT
ncbi:MAG: hypothetical protein Q9169_008497 [Polycauliona sp. 2 TL-2023]